MVKVFEAAVKAIQTGRPAALATVVGTFGSTPRKSGARMLIHGDGETVGSIGGGELEQRIKALAATVLETGVPNRYRTTDDLTLGGCAGDMEIHVEPLMVQPRLTLYGAGHVAHATVSILQSLGFTVQIVDDRAELLTEERFPRVNRLLTDPVAHAKTVIGTEDSYFILMTHQHDRDAALLEILLQKPHRWIGMLSSIKKWLGIAEALKERGLDPDLISSVHAPIGLDISASNPNEIAVSIGAQLVAERHEK